MHLHLSLSCAFLLLLIRAMTTRGVLSDKISATKAPPERKTCRNPDHNKLLALVDLLRSPAQSPDLEDDFRYTSDDSSAWVATGNSGLTKQFSSEAMETSNLSELTKRSAAVSYRRGAYCSSMWRPPNMGRVIWACRVPDLLGCYWVFRDECRRIMECSRPVWNEEHILMASCFACMQVFNEDQGDGIMYQYDSKLYDRAGNVLWDISDRNLTVWAKFNFRNFVKDHNCQFYKLRVSSDKCLD